MKCLVLAGGTGDRLWPLSRKNYPKQFIQIQKNHSLFQETVARNIPFCDEFIIVTNKSYEFIVENQLKVFQGITYRCIYEEIGRKTTAAIVLACMQLPQSELVFVVAADHIISGDSYKTDILKAKEVAKNGYIVTFGISIKSPDTRFGYIDYNGDTVSAFKEKPDKLTAYQYSRSGHHLVNSGMFLFQNGIMLNEFKRYSKDIYNSCKASYKERILYRNHLVFSERTLERIEPIAFEKTVCEKTRKAKVIHSSFLWQDINSLEDLAYVETVYPDKKNALSYECSNTFIVNQSRNKVVITNSLDNVTVINTDDAIYVGKNDKSDEIKIIMQEGYTLQDYFDNGKILHQIWGTYELIEETDNYLVKKVSILPGKTISAHKHQYRSEHWTIVCGKAKVILENNIFFCKANDSIDVLSNISHQVTNTGTDILTIIEVATGGNVHEDRINLPSEDVSIFDLDIHVEPFVKLLPAFKDYLWGGTKLRDIYNKQCEYDIIAESWELSTYEYAQSVVSTGYFKGKRLGNYLEYIGKEHWGWKCQQFSHFPILIKFIDAKKNLSVQVHPDDEYALEHENEYGKNEMWYVIDSEEGAGIYCGFKYNVSQSEVRKRIQDNSILEILNWIPVKKGDVFFIGAGTVHAIGKGVFICEIQQSSNCTYRLYDYDRADQFGNKRELHLEKAFDVLDYSKYRLQNYDIEFIQNENYSARVLSLCKYFECIHYTVNDHIEIDIENSSFYSVICISGSGTISYKNYSMEFSSGDSIFIPMNEIRVVLYGNCELILTHI